MTLYHTPLAPSTELDTWRTEAEDLRKAEEAERLRRRQAEQGRAHDWDYGPPDYDDCPFEPKAPDWGWLPDGRLVALDYSTPALD